MKKAFLFDLNGTMINDMHYHAEAWYDILNNDLNAGLSMKEVEAQMYGKNEELLIRVFGEDYFTAERMQEISMEKERRYQKAFRSKLALISGLPEFLNEAKSAGIPLAIGSAAIPFNIDFVLDNLNIRHYFDAIVSAADVVTSKPDPETYIKCSDILNIEPGNCIVFEDAPKGVEAARNAGMDCVVITTMHGIEEFNAYDNIITFIDDYSASSPDDFL